MARRKWDAKTKATIVLEGLKGKPVATVCQDYQLAKPSITSGATSF